MYHGWQAQYRDLLENLKDAIPPSCVAGTTFELIQHRFTKSAKGVIEARYPKTKLELDETKRKYKWERFGIGKYVYQDIQQEQIKNLFKEEISKHFPRTEIEYFT